jgi:hypothetical protein
MIQETAANLIFLRPLAIRWKFCLVAIAASLLAFYIFQVQDAARANFNISALEEGLDRERDRIQSLETAFSKMNSPSSAEFMLSRLDYEKIGKIYYIHTSDGRVALAD